MWARVVQKSSLSTSSLEFCLQLFLGDSVHCRYILAGDDQIVHGCRSGRVRPPVLLSPPGRLPPPPQEKAGAQVPETGN